ncbi:putative AIM2 family protein [Smittium mucronatum]|uniref:Putative AIM2 family protein n=1 Tax=Smittium mucronatum TaxID=133383 RepID=A0A1R0GU63_9FUNG|nr:putative AIM2 family protein [Smittium mucronatum]
MSYIGFESNYEYTQENYSPHGVFLNLKEDLECYITGEKNSKSAIIYLYDVFCMHPKAYKGADFFAENGYRVIIPDLLRNHPVRVEMLGDMQRIISRLNRDGSYKKLERDFKDIKDYLVNVENFERVFLVGFGWGAKKAMELSAHDDFYLGGALFYPSFLEMKDFEKSQAPMIIQSSKQDPDFTKGFAILKSKAFGRFCYLQIYDDMIHGFASGRGDCGNPKVKARTNEAFSTVLRYFYKILNIKP